MPSALAFAVPICLAVFGVLASHAFAVRRSEDYRSFWGTLILALLPAMMASVYFATDTGVPVIIRNTILGVLGGIIGLVSAIWLGYLISDARTAHADASPKIERAPAMPTDPHGSRTNIPPIASGNFNFDQRGGTVNQTYINQAQPRLQMTETLKRELLSKLPKDKKISIHAVGSVSDIQVGIQINEYLKDNGYLTDLVTIGMLIPPPDHALSWNSGTSTLVVAPSVRH